MQATGFEGMEDPSILEAFPVDDMQGMQGLLPGSMVAMDVEDYIVDSYNALAMQRRLTRQDVTALLELAGFPQVRPPSSPVRSNVNVAAQVLRRARTARFA